MKIVQEKQKVISKQDGLELSVQVLIPQDTVRGVIQIHHGMAEHKERYLPFMEYLAQNGFVAAIHDCRGHGESVQKKEDLGYTYGVGAEGVVEDTHQIALMLKERWPDCPFILLGHSMGSLVVRMFAKKYDDLLDLLIVSGPPCKNSGVDLALMILDFQEKFHGDRYPSRLLENLSFGSYAKNFPKSEGSFAWLCSEPTIVKAYEESELCGFTFTVDGYRTLMSLLKETYKKDGWEMKHPKLPILFLAGSEDPCIGGARKYAQSVQFMRLMGYKNTKGRLYPKMRHEVLNELEHEMVYDEIVRYIEKHILHTK